MPTNAISLRGVSVHNLKQVDLDIPYRSLVVLCGLSGSGKTSLALDTLYAEGQRRYIDSFSPDTRQFLELLEKPAADRIDGIPPAIAVTHKNPTRSGRATVGTASEVTDYLRLLLAKLGQCVCSKCQQPVSRSTVESVANDCQSLPEGTRFIVAFPLPTVGPAECDGESATDDVDSPALDSPPESRHATDAPIEDAIEASEIAESTRADVAELPDRPASPATDARADATGREELVALLRRDGIVRLLVGDALGTIDDFASGALSADDPSAPSDIPLAVVDRLSSGAATSTRLRESIETAFAKGNGRCVIAVAADGPSPTGVATVGGDLSTSPGSAAKWRRVEYSVAMRCARCGIDYPEIQPRLLNFNSPLGVCPTCEGFGNTVDIDMERIVPDPSKSIREGAIAPWNTPAYAHELEELLSLAPDFGIPIDAPFSSLSAEQVRLIQHGIPERSFGGLDGFFAWLEKRKYKMHLRVYLSRWKSARLCPACRGARLRPESLCVRVAGRNIAEIEALSVADARAFIRGLSASHGTGVADAIAPAPSINGDSVAAIRSGNDHRVARMIVRQLESRLDFLDRVGLGYLTLDRTLRSLSSGELQRVGLTATLGSTLVNMLYVLDEPSVGLHPRDTERLVQAVAELRDRGNSVVVVEHEPAMISAADQVIEIGPGAGERGGEVVFQGAPAALLQATNSLTGDFLAGRRGIGERGSRRKPDHGWIRLVGARGNNLRNLTVDFPLGIHCVVTGVSGAGKSSLVEETLYPALCKRLKQNGPAPLPFDDLFGDGQLSEVVLVDQSPIGRSPRSNPVTYVKAFDEIRAVFAETAEARTRNYDASHFSFNVDGGRCPQCQGDGYREIDMQFLADVYMRCSQCGGSRYRKEILAIKHRGRNIAEVLEMTVREAFTFFRGHPKVQAKLKRLIDVGLDYVRLGQGANTLSGGEAQRLKLAAYLQTNRRGRTLFILDEPTTGLHFQDVVQLLDCFDALLAVGNSLIVIEHNLQLMKAADYIIDLGPGAAAEGGGIVAHGTPEAVARVPLSVTGRFLANGDNLSKRRRDGRNGEQG